MIQRAVVFAERLGTHLAPKQQPAHRARLAAAHVARMGRAVPGHFWQILRALDTDTGGVVGARAPVTEHELTSREAYLAVFLVVVISTR